MKNPNTICVNCKHCIHDPDMSSDVTWYDYRCGAVIHEEGTNPVDGKRVYFSHETHFMTTDKHPNCLDMNNGGNCPLFEKRNELPD